MDRVSALNRLFQRIVQGNLVMQISVGIVLGIIVSLTIPDIALSFGVLGKLFVQALRSVAPILVFALVLSSVVGYKTGGKAGMKPILFMYLLGTFFAALIAVGASLMFPSLLTLTESAENLNPPSGVLEVLGNVLNDVITNPIDAIARPSYLGILVWALGLGIMLRHGADSTKQMIGDFSDAIVKIVQIVVRFAPLGVFGLLTETLASPEGFHKLLQYIHLLAVLLGCMFAVALVLNPLMVYWKIRRNPYPLVLTCLKESGLTAFMMRSSAANIPVNLNLCEKLKLDKEIYSVSIPLGAAINMAGAAVTITVLTLAAVYTQNIEVDFWSMLLLSLVASVCACGASGVAGGSLLLIPMACSMFGIGDDIAMQVVGVGFIIGVLQDSTETAVNSSTDVMFTAAVCMAEDRKQQAALAADV